MKQTKPKKAATEPVPEAGMTDDRQHELPDAEYVEQLLASTAPDADGETQAADASLVDGVIVLPSQCLLRDVVEYRERLLNCMDAQSVSIDASAVERIDTAFMQVLLAFVRDRLAAHAGVAWLNINDTFSDAAKVLGLQSALALSDVSIAA
jgi:anti-anti-sigma regulatory factor